LYDKEATKANILKAFDKLRKATAPNDRVVIFYAGHGVTESMEDGREKGFILPVEGSESEILTSSISTDQLNKMNNLIRAKHVFFNGRLVWRLNFFKSNSNLSWRLTII